LSSAEKFENTRDLVGDLLGAKNSCVTIGDVIQKKKNSNWLLNYQNIHFDL
jgi:hypothetical protein